MTAQIVIIGGGIGGVTCCSELRRLGYDGELTLVDAGEVLHERPPLTKEYLLGDESTLKLRPEEWFADHQITLLGKKAVRRIVVGAEQTAVLLADGEQLLADVVVLATGGTARQLLVPGVAQIYTLRTVDDAKRIMKHLVPGKHILVVGGGLLGAELAASATALGVTVSLTDPELPLASVVGVPVASWLHGMHFEHGVTVHTERVSQVTKRSDDGLVVQLTDGTELDVDAVIAGIGAAPDTALAVDAGARVEDGIIVGADQSTSLPGLYAIGDCARSTDGHGGLLPRVEHWSEAVHGATCAAAAILGVPAPPPQAPWFWSDRYGHHLEVVGDPTRGEQITRGVVGVPPFAIFAVAEGKLVGALSVDQPQAVRAARRIIERGVDISADELADPTVDLRRIAKR